jgi:hypothetical protein
VFAVLHKPTKRGDVVPTRVVAAGYTITAVDGGSLLTFSSMDGSTVAQFPPGTWEGVMDSIPGIDSPVEEE